jgi:beta-ketodecanoyl-[acyl-carrier-protein] synthase
MDRGFGFDMNVTGTRQQPLASRPPPIISETKRAVGVSIIDTSGHLNWRDQMLIPPLAAMLPPAILVVKMCPEAEVGNTWYAPKTQFSNSIRNNFGFLNRAHGMGPIDQSGRVTTNYSFRRAVKYSRKSCQWSGK